MLDSDKPAEERLYKSAIDCFIKVSKNEGAAGMSRRAELMTQVCAVCWYRQTLDGALLAVSKGHFARDY